MSVESELIQKATVVLKAAFLIARRGFHREARSVVEEAGFTRMDLLQLPVDHAKVFEIYKDEKSSAVIDGMKEEKEIKRFFYYLSVRVPPRTQYESEGWNRIWYDYVEAKNKKEAIKFLENDMDAIIKQKIVVARPKLTEDGIIEPTKKVTKADYKIFICEPDEYWDAKWQQVRTCQECGSEFTLLQAKQADKYANETHCSLSCNEMKKPIITMEDYNRGWGNGKPCIYKITNKRTGMVYIGQTTQVYTLRWYQHTFQPTKTKFHLVMAESKPEDWTYEVLETFSLKEGTKEKLREREHFWVKHYNSIENGYNSATVIAEEKKDESQGELELDRVDRE